MENYPLLINSYYLHLSQTTTGHPDHLMYEMVMELLEKLSKRHDLHAQQSISLVKNLLSYGPTELGKASFVLEAYSDSENAAIPGKTFLKYSAQGFEFWLRDKIADPAVGNHLVGEITIYPELAWTRDENGVHIPDPEFNIFEYRDTILGMAKEENITFQICNRLGRSPVFCRKRGTTYGPATKLDLLSEVQLRTHQFLNPDLTGATLVQSSKFVFAEVSVSNGLTEDEITYRFSLSKLEGITSEKSIQENLEVLFEGGEEAGIYTIEHIFLSYTE